MLKRTIEWTDYNGVQRKEDFYFHMTQAEITEWELSLEGGLVQHIEKISKTQDGPQLVQLIKDLLLKTYGEKSPDGRRFIKNEELRVNFSQTEPYSLLFMEISSDAKKTTEFVNGILPAELRELLEAEQAK
jgi:hypothetical protein